MSDNIENKTLLTNFVYQDNNLEIIDTLYYRLTTDDGNVTYISVNFTPFVQGSNVDVSELYSGINVIYMAEPDFSKASNEIIFFEGYRTGPLDIPNFTTYPALYNETLTIKKMNAETDAIEGFVQANAIYEDTGTTNVTEIPSVDYTVSIANGIFSGAKIVRITFDNNGTFGNVGGPSGTTKSRLVEILGFV